MTTSLTPMLTVGDAAEAIVFYERAFGAEERERTTTSEGHIVAELAIGGERFFVVDENPAAFNLSPSALGGTSVRMSLLVDDVDGSTERALAAGATEVFPVADQFYGLRQGRIADPYGHHWSLGTPL
jgi:PhnB protein